MKVIASNLARSIVGLILLVFFNFQEIVECLCKEVDTVTPAFFLFVFAPGSGDVILTENGSCIFTHDIVNIVKKSAALKGKPKVLIFHLSDPGLFTF